MALRIGPSWRRTAAIVLLAGVLGGCSSAELDDDDVVTTLRTELGRHGVQADDLRCPNDLRAEVGASVRCTFTVGGQPVDAVAKILGVEAGAGTHAGPTGARLVMKDVLERSVAKMFHQAGGPAGTGSCWADLPP